MFTDANGSDWPQWVKGLIVIGWMAGIVGSLVLILLNP